MTTAAAQDLSIDISAATETAVALLQTTGASREHAEQTAAGLIHADRSGIVSHGLLRLPLYVTAADAGGINITPEMRWLREGTGGALLDADAAFGQAAMHTVLAKARELLAESAVVVIAVQNSSHFGAAAYWTEQLAADGLLAVATSTTGAVVAPHGAQEAVIGTNPIALSSPGLDHPMTTDMATSAGAYGKVIAAKNAGRPIPEGWAVDSDGRPTTDPEAAMAGALTPFGGHKGSGLAVAIEAFSAVLGTGSFAYETEDIWVDPSSRMNVGHTLIVIDPDRFAGSDHARRRTSELRTRIRAAGSDVLAPGDPEETARRSHRERIPLAASTVEQINTLAREREVRPLGDTAST